MEVNLKLDIDSDLSFHSFVEAYQKVNDRIREEQEKRNLNYRSTGRVLTVNMSNYPAAFKISVAADIAVHISGEYEDDEWSYSESVYTTTYDFDTDAYVTGKITVHTEGA